MTRARRYIALLLALGPRIDTIKAAEAKKGAKIAVHSRSVHHDLSFLAINRDIPSSPQSAPLSLSYEVPQRPAVTRDCVTSPRILTLSRQSPVLRSPSPSPSNIFPLAESPHAEELSGSSAVLPASVPEENAFILFLTACGRFFTRSSPHARS